MALEWRGSNFYYYRKERRDGRVVSVYTGAGEFGRVMADLDRIDREDRRAAQQQHRTKLHQDQQALTLVRGTERDTRTLVHAVLVYNGYHQHKRQWRKARMTAALATLAPAQQPRAATTQERMIEGNAALRDALTITIEPTGKGEKAVRQAQVQTERAQRQAVRQVLTDYPELWTALRRQVAHAQTSLISAACGSHESVSGIIFEHTVMGIRVELGAKDAPPLEKLLIEQIALTWLDLEMVTTLYSQQAIGNHQIKMGDYWDRRLNSAQARYLRAVEMLARVRKLAQPTPLQVNIGGQQINVAGASPSLAGRVE